MFGVYVLGLDMGGYTLNQLILMNNYETLLEELGEESYGAVGSNWPVQIRIIFMAVVNALVFIIIKLCSTYLGPALGGTIQNIINSMMTQENPEEYISRAQQMANNPVATPGPSAAPNSSGSGRSSGGSGMNLGSMLGGLASMFGMGGNGERKRTRPRARRAPTHNE